MGTMNLMCGGAAFRVAFEDARAVIVNDDGGNTELAHDAAAPSEPGVKVYTDGKSRSPDRAAAILPPSSGSPAAAWPGRTAPSPRTRRCHKYPRNKSRALVAFRCADVCPRLNLAAYNRHEARLPEKWPRRPVGRGVPRPHTLRRRRVMSRRRSRPPWTTGSAPLPACETLAEEIELGSVPTDRFHEKDCASPLPRAYQWADGSAYVNHVAAGAEGARR